MTKDITGNFKALAQHLTGQNSHRPIIAVDPGETTGVAVFDDYRFLTAQELVTKDLASSVKLFQDFFVASAFKCSSEPLVICEDYRVYGWKTEQHAWAGLHTPKLIGIILAVCQIESFEICFRMAHEVKQFCTDDKLQAWGYYHVGSRHARDAIRHATFHTLFGNLPQDTKKTS